MIRLGRSIAIASAFACFASVGATPAFAEETVVSTDEIDPVMLQVARELVDAAFPPEEREALLFSSMDQLLLQVRQSQQDAMPINDEGMDAILDQWLDEYLTETKEILRGHLPSLMDGMARSYAVMFTRTELEDIRDFARTESGRRYFQQAPTLLAEPNFAAANQAYMSEIMQALPEAQKDLRDRLMDYLLSKEVQSQSLGS